MNRKLLLMFAFVAIIFSANAQVKVSSNGNVGIGTTTPTQKLHVAGNAYLTGNVGIGTASPSQKLHVAGNAYLTGNVGIGVASPSQKLHVAGNAYLTGNVGIGVASPSRKLHVYGNALIDAYNVTDWGSAIGTKVYTKSACAYHLHSAYYGKDVFYVCGEGYLWTMKRGYFGSDIAMKKNIEPINGALDLVKKLNGVRYQYIDGVGIDDIAEKNPTSKINEEYRIGLIAQEVELIVPEVVKTMYDSTKAISYTDLIALLIEAIKEQQNIIEKSQQKAETRDAIIEELQQEVETLKNALIACCSNKNQKSMQEFDITSPTNVNAEEMKVYQNAPNPFNESTTIQCYIPGTIQKAELCVYDMQGSRLKCLLVSERGTTAIQIQAGQLASGVYTYLLIGDGKTSDAKQMILTK